MSSRQLLLRRGDHNSRLTEGFESLLDTECMTDVTIACGQHIIKAHRTVLSIFSPFFKRLFASIQNPMHYPFVVLKDMPYTDLKAIVDLMYRGEVAVYHNRLASLKQSAKTLEVLELSDIINSYERNETKPKLEEISGKNTRKRGRPRRYCEDSEEDLIELPTTAPPTKRQQVLLSKTPNKITVPSVPQKGIRGGVHFTVTRPQYPVVIRGGQSAFIRPQTAVRGGMTAGPVKPPTATRGRPQFITRGRGIRFITREEDEDYDPHQDRRHRTRNSRGRYSSITSMDLPMATSLPLSVPEPIQVDLTNIFPNFNANVVTSSTTNVPIVSIPIIKREVDSDSEVECIMSATSPLPSDIIEDTLEETSCHEVTTNSETIRSTSSVLVDHIDSQSLGQSLDQSLGQSLDQTMDTTSEVTETECNVIHTNITIKTERPDTSVTESVQIGEQTQDSITSSVTNDVENGQTVGTDIQTITTASQPQLSTESMSATAPTVISLNTNDNETDVPLIRSIKTERMSPPTVQPIQPMAVSANDSFDASDGSVPQVSDVPSIHIPLSGVKVERMSPKSTENDDNNAIDISQEDSSDMTSSATTTTTVDVINDSFIHFN